MLALIFKPFGELVCDKTIQYTCVNNYGVHSHPLRVVFITVGLLEPSHEKKERKENQPIKM